MSSLTIFCPELMGRYRLNRLGLAVASTYTIWRSKREYYCIERDMFSKIDLLKKSFSLSLAAALSLLILTAPLWGQAALVTRFYFPQIVNGIQDANISW